MVENIIRFSVRKNFEIRWCQYNTKNSFILCTRRNRIEKNRIGNLRLLNEFLKQIKFKGVVK